MPAAALRKDARPLELSFRRADEGSRRRGRRAHGAHLAPVPRGLRPCVRGTLGVDLPDPRFPAGRARTRAVAAHARLDVRILVAPASKIGGMLVDSHCHLDFPELQADFPAILERMRAQGVTHALTISTTLE